jgi:hypothetical protein
MVVISFSFGILIVSQVGDFVKGFRKKYASFLKVISLSKFIKALYFG